MASSSSSSSSMSMVWRSLHFFFALVPLLMLLCTSFSDALSQSKQSQKSSSDENIVGHTAGAALIDWIRASGGHSDVRVGVVVDAPAGAEPTSTRSTSTKKTKRKKRTKKKKQLEENNNNNNSALRGTLATRDIAAGEVVVSIPSNITVPLGGTGVTSPENVVLLFARRASDPAWFREMQPYWDSLPASVFTKEMYEPEHMALLQDDELAKLSRNEVSWIQRVYSGETMHGRTPSLDEAVAGAPEKSPAMSRPSLDEFRHLTAVVASYAFHLPDDEGTDRTVMLPLLDLVNHANAGVANAIVAREGEHFTARALRDISEGEEVTHMYSHGNARNDHTVLHYGFLDRSRWDEPRLCCSDIDGSNLWHCGPGGDIESLGATKRAALIERYSAKLANFATNEQQDGALMAASNHKNDWKTRLLVEFRMLRKRALQQAIDKLTDKPSHAGDEL